MLTDVTVEYKVDIDLQWHHMEILFKKDRFKDVHWSEQLWRRIYCLVCTRSFGYYLNFTFMLPVMDMINHEHKNECGLYTLNKELHVDPMKCKSYFKSNKYLNDVRMLYN